ncbi:MAG: hypothetical protein J6Y78_06340 [Paludibacteraceae bacterium]|nr:hypothetical protein [Paludibacteraceae bacterium]
MVECRCQTCSRYYRFDDDLGEALCQGCELDLPNFNPRNVIECSSYIKIGGWLDN